jgi:tetratricopeptide (TPR) repeat protein
MVAEGKRANELTGRADKGGRVIQAVGDVHVHEHEVSVAAAAMHTLPRDTVVFTGRDAELARLLAAVTTAISSDYPVSIHAIDGMAGVGKTALAIHAGHLLAERFPEGQYFLRLHGHTPGRMPVESADALASLLVADGVSPQEIPPDVDARAALWRHRLAGRRTLIILDDVVGHDQVEPLLPGSNECLVMITSRRRLTAIDAAVTLPLDVLPTDVAVELFIRVVGRAVAAVERQAVRDIVTLCGCLPLAVSVLAGHLRHHPKWTAEDQLAELRSAHDRLAELHAEDVALIAAFETSYRDLAPDQKLLFRLLSLHPGVDFDVYCAAALAGMSMTEARQCVAGLYGDHLLDELARGRYQMHDLVRDYASSLAGDIEQTARDDAVARLLDYFEYTATVAGRHVSTRVVDELAETAPHPGTPVPDISGLDGALAWLTAARGSLLACAYFAHRTQDRARLVRLVSAVATFLRHSGPWNQAARLDGLAVEAARQDGDRAGEAGALINLGVILRLKGDYQDSRGALTSALSIYREIGDRLGEAEALMQLGSVQQLSGQYQGAIDAATDALAIYRDLENRVGQANALIGLGTTRPLVGDYPGAEEALAQSLEISRELGDRFAEANALSELGAARHLVGDYPGAVDALNQALEISRDLNAQTAEAYALNEIGLVRQFVGDYVGANAASTEALKIYREWGSRAGEADALAYLGGLGTLTSDYGNAAEALAEALAIYTQLGDPFGQARALTRLGTLRCLTGDHDGADEALTRALKLYRELGHQRGEAETMNSIGALLLERDEPERAMAAYRTALTLARQVSSPMEEALALEGSGRCARALGNGAEAIGFLRAAETIYRTIGSVRHDQVVDALAGLENGSSGR